MSLCSILYKDYGCTKVSLRLRIGIICLEVVEDDLLWEGSPRNDIFLGAIQNFE